MLERGATLTDEGVRFAVWAPTARAVAVRIESRSPGGRDHALERDEQGVWSGLVRDAAAGTDYRFVVVDEKGEEQVVPDPASRFQPDGVHGASRVIDPHAFEWTDDGWRGVPLAEYAIYEMHVGTFSEEGTFDGAIAHLPELVDLGITGVEVMPIAQLRGER